MIDIGKLGIWFSHNPLSITDSIAFAQQVEASDRLVDDIVAWGDVDAVQARLQAHYEAGADHVCILPLSTTGRLPNMATVKALAPTARA
jgi:2-methylisocitrate lyase-like PEP mutase family enzyme